MWTSLGQVLPIAVALALSSVPILTTIVLLLSPQKGRAPLAFLIGWIAGLALTFAAFVLFASLIPTPPPWQSDVPIAIVIIVAGIAIIAYAVINWRRSAGAPSRDLPKWLEAAGSMHAPAALGLGFVLNLRPKGILLTVAAAAAARGENLTIGEATIVVALYAAIAGSTVAVPIIASWARPQRTRRQLQAARRWLVANGRIVSTVVMILVGAAVIGNGLSRL